MTIKKFKKLVSGMENQESRNDHQLLSICYFLINTGRTAAEDSEDLMTIYDNLFINNEIIDDDNFKEYDLTRIEEKHFLKPGKIEKKIKAGYICLLNYYSKGLKGNFYLNDCCIFLNAAYDVMNKGE